MILNRLYELAQRKRLLADPAFEDLPVPYVVVVDKGGEFLGIQERRGEIVTVKKAKKGDIEKRTPDRGMVCSVPRPHGNTASQGFARFFVDTLPRVLPVVVEEKDRAKVERSRQTFWQQLDTAADATNDAALARCRRLAAGGGKTKRLSPRSGRVSTRRSLMRATALPSRTTQTAV